MFTNFKTTIRGSSVAANAARLVLGLGLFGLANASAAFTVNGTLANSATFSGSLTINTTGNIDTAITAASITISAPTPDTCGAVINFQGHAGLAGYYFNLSCTSLGPLMLTLNTPLSALGYLNGYTGGTFDISSPADSFYHFGVINTVPINIQVTGGSVSSLVAPTFSKAFSGATVPLGGITILTFTIVNPNAVALTGLAFTDTLPAGLTLPGPFTFAPFCGGTGTVVGTVGPPATITMSANSLPAGATCVLNVAVEGSAAGTQNNVTSTLTSNAPAAPAATASIVVTVPPTFSKAFGATQIFDTQTTNLTFTIGNSNPVALTGLAFTDPLPVGLVVANVPGIANTCGGTVVATPASGSISLANGTIAAGATCTITVTVAGLGVGVQNNVTSTLTSNEATAAAPATASILLFLTLDGSFQVSYAADPAAGESYINIINDGAQGAPLQGPGFGTQTGNICVQVYAFAPDEQEISCCTCTITPNSVANLGVNRDLTSNTLTNVIPTSVVVKLVAINPTSTASGSCTAAQEGTPVSGMVAYGTTPQPLGTVFNVVEHSFRPSTLSTGPTTGNNEYASITGRCAAILGNGSSFGVCNSCKSGALGADKQ